MGKRHSKGSRWRLAKLAKLMVVYNGRCGWCGRKVIKARADIPGKPRDRRPNVATIDHAVSLEDGGSNREENLVLSCLTCNQLKGSESLTPPHLLEAVE